MIDRMKLTQTINHGVVTFNPGYGHWATGSTDVTIDGKVIKGDRAAASGSISMRPCGLTLT